MLIRIPSKIFLFHSQYYTQLSDQVLIGMYFLSANEGNV